MWSKLPVLGEAPLTSRARFVDKDQGIVTTAVIVATHSADRIALLERALVALARQTVPVQEIVVVVDGNTKLSRHLRRTLQMGVRVIDNDHGPGASGARNSGAAAARASVIVFMDDDALPRSDCIAQLVQPMHTGSPLGTGGRALPLWEGVRPSWFGDELGWVVGCHYRGMPDDMTPVRNVFASCMSVRRDVFDAIGGFRESFGNQTAHGRGLLGAVPGCEETELCIRASRAFPGAPWLYCPKAIVDHYVPRQRASVPYLVRRSFGEGRAKAALVEIVGAETGLSAERRYVLDAILGRNRESASIGSSRRQALQASGAVAAAVASAAAGYGLGQTQAWISRHSDDEPRRPPAREHPPNHSV